MCGVANFSSGLLAQRGHLFCWVPVCLGIGIAAYFNLRFEPSFIACVVAGILAAVPVVLTRLAPVSFAPVLVAISLILGGGLLAKVRTELVERPVMEFRYYGPIEGRIIGVDRSASDAARLTLDQVVLARLPPDKTPERIRVSVHGDDQIWQAGDVVLTTGHISPPSGPAEPGGFDFQRHAWFLQLGGVGYTRNPVVRFRTADLNSWRLWVFAKRRAVSLAVQSALPGETGAFAAAILTGDRSGMSKQSLADLRATNLAHLLAISGLHMGLLTGFVFGVVRIGLAFIAFVAVRLPTKKIAAVSALIVGGAYLLMSGGNVATERAYTMVAVMLVAVLLDRQAVTLRAVAIAATLILIAQPEALVGPGFQMSFAATTALIATFQALKGGWLQRLPNWAKPVVSLIISSAVAGVATAPIAAAHFNQIAHFGLIANILSVPLMGVLVMPAAVLAALLLPFGLSWIGLALMDLGLRWIIFVAQEIAVLDHGVGYVHAPDGNVLGIFALGALWCVLWQGPKRHAGLIGIVSAFAIWIQTERPMVLVSDTGGLIGMLGDEGRDLSKAKGSGFVASIWLENDGDVPDQKQAADRPYLIQSGRMTTVPVNDAIILQVTGKTALVSVAGCNGADVLILTVENDQPRPCLVYDIKELRKSGSLAINPDGAGGITITTAKDVAGARPWNTHLGRNKRP